MKPLNDTLCLIDLNLATRLHHRKLHFYGSYPLPTPLNASDHLPEGALLEAIHWAHTPLGAGQVYCVVRLKSVRNISRWLPQRF